MSYVEIPNEDIISLFQYTPVGESSWRALSVKGYVEKTWCFRWFKKKRLDSAVSLFWNKYAVFSPLEYGYRLWVCRDVIIVFVDLELWAEKFQFCMATPVLKLLLNRNNCYFFNVLLKCYLFIYLFICQLFLEPWMDVLFKYSKLEWKEKSSVDKIF